MAIYRQNSASSSDIKTWQKQLNSLGYDTGGVDGVWGSKTAKAISDYKKSINQNNSFGNSIGTSTLNRLASDAAKVTNNTKAPSVKWDTNDTMQKAYQNMLQTGNTEAQGIKSQWDSALANAQNYYDSSANTLGSTYNSNVNQANVNADEAARQQYIAYKQNKNKLGEQLSAGGITGGASETALNNVLNAYSSALSSNEGDRQQALSELANSYQNELANLYQSLMSNQSNINNQFGSAYAEAETDYNNRLSEAKLASDQEQSVNKWNTNVSKKIASLKPKYVWMDNIGKLHYSSKKSSAQAAEAAGYTIIGSEEFVDAHTPKTTTSTKSKSTTDSSTSTSNFDYNAWLSK